MSLLGRLNWDAIPDEMIVQITMLVMAIGAISVLGIITYLRNGVIYGRSGLPALTTNVWESCIFWWHW